MRLAKLAYLDRAPPAYQAPYYWSHLSVIGDSSELDVLSPNKPTTYVLPLALILLGFVGLLYWSRRNSRD